MIATVRRARCLAGVSMAVLLAALAFAPLLTRSMALHMLLHIPMIVVAGVLGGMALQAGMQASGGGVQRWLSRFAKYNEFGVAGLVLCTFVWAYWMIPRSLDAVLVSTWADAFKFVGLFFAGMVLWDSLSRSNSVINLFFVGNFSWMTAVAGVLYRDNVERLCNFYLLSDQELTGLGLLILALAVPVMWVAAEQRRVRRFLR